MGGSSTNGFDRGMTDTSTLMSGQSGQSGYARGGPVQTHSTFEPTQHNPTAREDPRIRNVYAYNLEEEMRNLRSLVDSYPYIAMVCKPDTPNRISRTHFYPYQDTEFPGIVARPIGSFTTKADYHYQTLRCNVDLLKMIQLGITLFKVDGSTPADSPAAPSNPANLVPSPCTWQFNFKFSLDTDMYASDSTQMLAKAGLDFTKHKGQGIDPEKFGALLITSGLVLDDEVKWISFHSGYDFGYLMKIMINKQLPDEETKFHELLEKYFPTLFDIKYIVKNVGMRNAVNNNQSLTPEANTIIQNITQKSGLQDLADALGIQRVGMQHQAGSDSLLTGQVYFEMRKKIFGGTIDEDRYVGLVWGLNGHMPTSNSNHHSSTPNMNGAASAFYIGGHGANGGASGNPSTPQTGHVNLAHNQSHVQTPGPPQSSHGSYGAHTPGGVFGNFQYKAA